jgi:autotransporter-associated beta strand protein
MKSQKFPAVLSRMKKNDRRGGPVSKMVMAALVLASTAGFVSGLSRNVFNDDGLPGWVYVRGLFASSLPGQMIAAVTDSNHSVVPRSAARSISPVRYSSPAVWLERDATRFVTEPREIAADSAASPVVNANGTATFDPNLFNIATTTTSPSVPKTSTTTLAPLAVDLYWDQNKATAGTGGTGTWVTAGEWRLGSPTGTLQDWADGNNAHFEGTAGVVSIASGTTVSPVTTFFEVTGYTLTPSSTALTTLAGSISLSANVNLTLNSAVATTDRQLAIGSVTGGANSSLTISGAQIASGSNSRILLSQAGASIDVPITISGGGVGGAFAGFVATNTGTGITGTIANSSNFTTLLGATSGNDLTLSSTAVISGTAGLRIGVTNSSVNVGTVTLNAANTYGGGATLDGGTLVLGNDTALSTGTLTLSNSSTSVLQAGTSARTLANNIVWGGDGTISGSNAFTFNGTLTSSGSSTRSMTVSNTNGLTINGNVFLAPDNVTARGLTIKGTSAVTINGVIANNASATPTTASNLTYSGSNTLTLTNANTYTGTTTLGTSALGSTGTINAAANGALGSGTTGTSSITVFNGGTLMLSNATATDRVRDSAPIQLGGGSGPGTASIQRSGGGSEGSETTLGLGSLTLQANASLNYGGALVANGTLSFGSLAPAPFVPNGFTLSILGYNGVFGTSIAGVDGVTDRLIFGSSQLANLGNFSFINPDGLTGTYGADQILLASGFYEIVPVPEPSTWVGGALALLAVAYTQRRRFAKSRRKEA